MAAILLGKQLHRPEGARETAFVPAPVGDIKQLEITPDRLYYTKICIPCLHTGHKFICQMGGFH
ncbi:MAG: hypothetical protein LBI79_05005 [Nitrososphaerota archaeon]|nr:hypothetical protein [Nitrososphaerota archaeon]